MANIAKWLRHWIVIPKYAGSNPVFRLYYGFCNSILLYMGKHLHSRVKVLRRLGTLPGLTEKYQKNRNKTPGQHGTIIASYNLYSSLSDDFKKNLIEKQKIRYNFGIREKQLIKHYKFFKSKKMFNVGPFLSFLEHRLDCLLYRSGFISSIPAARQIINHGHVLVNDKKINISSFNCKIFDKISFKNNPKIKKFLKDNFLNSECKRKIISERKKSALEIISSPELKDFEVSKIIYSTLLNTKLKTDIPPHIEIDFDLIEIYFISSILEEDIHLSINENKIIQYYSNQL